MKRVVPDGKDITMDNFLYRLYVHLWRDCYPLRMFLLPGKSLCPMRQNVPMLTAKCTKMNEWMLTKAIA